MARVKCVMMQRDEDQLLEPWLRYHGYLFGFENLTVFDNGSVEPYVLATLDRFERFGVTMYRNFAGRQNFEGKGFHFTNIIRGWDFGGDYDFAVPMDCDEFLVLLERDGINCGRRAIHRAFDALIGEERALGIEFSMFNIPDRAGTYRPQWYPKGFFARDTISVLDHGFHRPIAKVEGRRETEFAYLHYHNKPYASAFAAAERKLRGYVDLSKPETWEGYTGPGNHLLRMMNMTEADYYRQFDDSVMMRFDGLEALLRLLGPLDSGLFPPPRQDDAPSAGTTSVRDARTGAMVPFGEDAYYRLNPDVAAHRIEGLKHYFRHGFEEKRAVREEEVEAPPEPEPRVVPSRRARARQRV